MKMFAMGISFKGADLDIRQIQRAKEYTEGYARTYGTADEDALESIFVSHLAYLVNCDIDPEGNDYV